MLSQFLTEFLVGLFGVAAYNVFFNPNFKDELAAPTQWRHRIRDLLVVLISIQFYKLLIR